MKVFVAMTPILHFLTGTHNFKKRRKKKKNSSVTVTDSRAQLDLEIQYLNMLAVYMHNSLCFIYT